MSKFETAMQEASGLHQTLLNEYASLLTVLERVKAGTVRPDQLSVNMADLTWAIIVDEPHAEVAAEVVETIEG